MNVHPGLLWVCYSGAETQDGDTADLRLGQPGKELTQTVAEMVATQQEQAAVLRRRQEQLEGLVERWCSGNLSYLTSHPTRCFCACAQHESCDQPGRSLPPHPSPLLGSERLVPGRGRGLRLFLLPTGGPRSNHWVHQQLTHLLSQSRRVVVSFIPAEAESSPVQSWDIIQAHLGTEFQRSEIIKIRTPLALDLGFWNNRKHPRLSTYSKRKLKAL
ncbi:transducin beta-like protein 2 [Sarotherodon galilaeus]